MRRKLTNYERATLTLVLTKLAKEKDFDGVLYHNSIAGSIGSQDKQMFFRSFFGNDNKVIIGFSGGSMRPDKFYYDLIAVNDKFELRANSEEWMSKDITKKVQDIILYDSYILNKCLDTIGQLIFKDTVEITNVVPEDDKIQLKIKDDNRLPSFDFKVIDNNFVLVAHILAGVNDTEIESIIASALVENIYDYIDKVQYVYE